MFFQLQSLELKTYMDIRMHKAYVCDSSVQTYEFVESINAISQSTKIKGI